MTYKGLPPVSSRSVSASSRAPATARRSVDAAFDSRSSTSLLVELLDRHVQAAVEPAGVGDDGGELGRHVGRPVGGDDHQRAVAVPADEAEELHGLRRRPVDVVEHDEER